MTSKLKGTVSVDAVLPVRREGMVISETEEGFVVRIKKYRSSYYYEQFIPKDQIIYAVFWSDRGTKMGNFCLKEKKQKAYEMTGEISFQNGFILVEDEKETETCALFRTGCSEVMSGEGAFLGSMETGDLTVTEEDWDEK